MASGRKLKVGFVFDDSLDNYDGVAQYVKTLGSWLSAQGHQVRYLVGETKAHDWEGNKIYSLSKNQKVSFNGNQVRIPLPAKMKPIKKALNDEKFDILHVQVPYSPFMAQKVINAAGPETAIIGTFHIMPKGFLSSAGSRLLRIMYGRSLARFDQIVSVSAPAAEFAKSAYGIDSSVMPNVIDIGRFSAPTKKINLRKTPNIVFLGRLVQRKGCHELIKAFDALRRYGHNARLVIAGDGPERDSLEKLAQNLGLKQGSDIDFLGFVEENAKPSLLASADIACYPSLYGESFGIVLLEAMASGAGVVLGGNNPGYKSVLGEKPELLINPKDTLSFASRLNELLNDREKSKQLHEWQQAEVKKYDVNVVGKKLVDIYLSLIDKRLTKADNQR